MSENGSLKYKISTNIVPTVPIPVNTEYAVPIGIFLVASISSWKLTKIAMSVKILIEFVFRG